jgi:hypothetical protein
MVRILTFLIVFYDLRFIDWLRVPGSELNHESVDLWQGRGNRHLLGFFAAVIKSDRIIPRVCIQWLRMLLNGR